MRNYWTCSKFADWLRGTDKPGAATGKEWGQWKRASKEKHPFRYWLAEEGLDHLQDVWMWIPERIHDIRYYINNRYITRTHCLTSHPSNIKRGQWCDVGNRFLPCLFNELVDFVEVEQAWHHVIWDEEARKKYKTPWSRSFFRFRTWRCPEAGIDYLKWAMTLTNKDFIEEGQQEEPTYQAKAAKEIFELYTWWKEIYPNRPDVHDASGWTAYCEMRRNKNYEFFDLEVDNEEEAKIRDKALDKTRDLELQYANEDEEMMIRLIKIRESLWT